MQYGGFDVYKIYLAVKNHFTTKYDYAKYDGKVNAKLEGFTKRHDRYFFHKLSKRYDSDRVLDYFVANFAHDGRKWIGNLINNEGTETYNRYRKYKESFEYCFRSDCSYINNDFISRGISFDDGLSVDKGQHPRILRLLIQRKIHIQTAIILDTILSFSKVWNKKIEEKIVWPEIHKRMEKLKPFMKFNMTQAKLIMKDVFVNN